MKNTWFAPMVLGLAASVAACSSTQGGASEAASTQAGAGVRTGLAGATAAGSGRVTAAAGAGASGPAVSSGSGAMTAATRGTAGVGGADPASAAGSGGASGAMAAAAAAGASGATSAAGVGGESGAAAAAGVGGASGAPTAGATGGAGGDTGGAATAMGPCDIYASGNTPCVAAHSTVRALYAAYGGNLYQVRRASDRTTKDIGVLAPGGFADSAAQDAFCAGTTCTISILYDQSPKGNDLKSAPAGGAKRTPDDEASATGLKLTVGGHSVYAVFIKPGMGYRVNRTSGIATGDQPEGEYMVTSGKHYNNGCCFDYGNAETNNLDNGNGTMEAIYFGNCTSWGRGNGRGPWVMADLENGLFAGTNGVNNNNTPITDEYVTAMVKGKPGHFAIKGSNAQSGMLKTMYDGARPTPGYDPMKKEGAIILGIGGDNSNSAQGTFFEGCMTSGYPSDEIDDAIQANIIAAGYGR